MTIPGRAELSFAPTDWPETLHPGSLNVLIADNGYPDEFFRFPGEGVQKLDSGCFVPAFVIPGAAIVNNSLRPTADNARRGDAQVWRAELRCRETGQAGSCWVLRRIGSARLTGLELVAAERLRDKMSLADGARVAVELDGYWW
jgi:hypothetical protein